MNTTGPLLEEFHAHCLQAPEEPALILPGDGEAPITLSRTALRSRIQNAACELQRQGVRPSDTVLIKLPHRLDLLLSLLGCLELGAVPCLLNWRFVHAGSAGDLEQVDRQAGETSADFLLTTTTLATSWREQPRLWSGRVLIADELACNHPASSPPAGFAPATGPQVACLQITSGTTGAGRAVELSAPAIKHCLSREIEKLALKPADRVLNWLPLFHDLGLFAGILGPLMVGSRIYWMSPARFLRRPAAFLALIATERISVTFATNATLHQLSLVPTATFQADLSSLRLIICGGEPLRHESLQRFEMQFESARFDPCSWLNGYGLAETVVGVVLRSLAQPTLKDWIDPRALNLEGDAVPCASDTPGCLALVSCGTPWHAEELEIRDEANTVLPERRVGEVCLRGPFLFNGYRGQPDATAQVLRDGWLHTGDLGYLADGHLFICGRRKDLIILGGVNLHPEEIEAAAQKATGLNPGHLVAFGIPDETSGTEGIVLAVETKAAASLSPASLELLLRRHIMDATGFAPKHIVFVPRGWIAKTTSGKISRHRCRAQYLADHTN